MSAGWLAVRVQPGSRRDAVLAALFAEGVQAVQEIDGGFATSIRDPDAAERLRSAVVAASADAQVDVRPSPNVDWTQKWKASIRAHDLGELVVCPPWLADEEDPARRIVIEPAMAFGTGEHETTRGVLRLMQHVVRRGDRVADLGAGSAVLAIAAARLGAASVVAIELDHDAIENAEQNVLRNGVGDQVTVIEGDAGVFLSLIAPVRVITANIISPVLRQLLPLMTTALTADGQVILSGILDSEREELSAELRTDGWNIGRDDGDDAWWSVVVSRR
jgi:ribosomal protein L11 methyltransferase